MIKHAVHSRNVYDIGGNSAHQHHRPEHDVIGSAVPSEVDLLNNRHHLHENLDRHLEDT